MAEMWQNAKVEVSSDGRIRYEGVIIAYLPHVKIVVRDLNGEYVGCYRDVMQVVRELRVKESAVLNVLRGRQRYHAGYSFWYV